MSTAVYTYHFPGSTTFLGEVADAGTDLFPSDELEPADDLYAGFPPQYKDALYPGLTVLYAVIDDPVEVPRDPSPIYTVYVADTRSGRIGWELPHEKFSWDTPLNAAGTMSVTVPIEDVIHYEDRDERSSRNLLREIATGPWRFTFALAYGGRVVWAGPLVAVKLQDSAQSIDFGCVELQGLLDRRLLINPGASSPTVPEADTVYQGTTLPNIARSLLEQSVLGDGAELPVDFPTVPTAGTHQRFYYGYDLATVGERLTQLTKVINGPDVRLDPYLVVGQDANYLRWSLVVGDPYLPAHDPWTFEYGVNASLDYDLDSKDMAFDYFVPGSGQDRDKRLGRSTDRTLVDAGFPLLQAVDTSHASAVEQITLDDHAAGDIETYGRPVESWTLGVQANLDPRLGEYRVGDTVAIGVQGHLLIEDGLFTRRVTSLSGDQSGNVSMTGSSKPEEVSAESDDAVLGKTESQEQTVSVVSGTVPEPVWETLRRWGYTGDPIQVPRSTLAAAYAYQDELVSV